ncbi:hypothetical protein [Aneurinibacillus tyrosinisolvens]|uniref:hypothetical protein n=1 Tax=Aneurinibacillus tyrosinisolvens TaxID=1443435 RepID=UPI00063FB9F5|nr:hypothetical protein [Aneurinibacillus tyrosinisolvens]
MKKADESLIANLTALIGLNLDPQRIAYLTPQINQTMQMYQQLKPIDILEEPVTLFNPINFSKGDASK